MPTYREPINRFVLYESKVRTSLRPGAPTRRYRQQISSHLLPGEKALEAIGIWKIAVNIFAWNKQNDDDDDSFYSYSRRSLYMVGTVIKTSYRYRELSLWGELRLT